MQLPTLSSGGLTLRPLREADLDALVAAVTAPGVAEWWVPAADLREDLRHDGNALAIEVDGAPAGWLGVSEEDDPHYRHASLDIFLAPAFQGRGLGPRALRLVAEWLVRERGHHRITIDPAAANERAIRAYRAVGFRPVGGLRRYERGQDGEWHDNLLMDLLAQDLG